MKAQLDCVDASGVHSATHSCFGGGLRFGIWHYAEGYWGKEVGLVCTGADGTILWNWGVCRYHGTFRGGGLVDFAVFLWGYSCTVKGENGTPSGPSTQYSSGYIFLLLMAGLVCGAVIIFVYCILPIALCCDLRRRRQCKKNEPELKRQQRERKER
jgi:hypothetical protein